MSATRTHHSRGKDKPYGEDDELAHGRSEYWERGHRKSGLFKEESFNLYMLTLRAEHKWARVYFTVAARTRVCRLALSQACGGRRRTHWI
jgi:hypothetical protein